MGIARSWFSTRLALDRRGNVTMLVAGAMAMLISSTALAVDIGSMYLAKRKLQGVADVAAMSAANASTSATTAANAAITANSDGNARLVSVTPGGYTADPGTNPAQRFVANATPANAAQVVVTIDVPLFFGIFASGRATTPVTATATAARTDVAAFSIGSRLAAVQGGLPNALLSGLAGTSLNLGVMDYNALTSANVDILAFCDALRTQASLGAISFGDTLNSTITLPQALNAVAAATDNPSAATAMRSIALKVAPVTIAVSALINLGPFAADTHTDPSTVIQTDGYAIVREMLALANGQRQVSLNLGLSLPGITSTQLTMAIGQRPSNSPWLAIAKDRTVVVRTAQTRLYIDSSLSSAATLGLLSLRLPIYVELAQAQATLSAISCSSGQANASVTLAVVPAIGETRIADIDMSTLNVFTAPISSRSAVIARSLLVSVTGQSLISLGGTTAQSVPFSADDIANQRIRTVSTNDLTQGIASSLVSKINLNATALGLGVNLSSVTAAVGAALTPVAPTLDSLLDQITGLVGVRLGQADVRINGLRCGRPTVVG